MPSKQRNNKAVAKVTLLHLEVTVIGVSVLLVLQQATTVLPVWASGLVSVCMCSQFLALAIKTFNDDIQPQFRQCFRSRADPGYLCSLLVPLAVIADIIYVNNNTILTDAQYTYSMLGYACFTSTQAALFITNARAGMSSDSHNNDVTVKWCVRSILISAAEISSGFLIAKLEWSLMVMIVFQAYVIFCILHASPYRLPKSFSVGELSCVVQMFGLVVWRSLHALRISSGKDDIAFTSFHIDCINSIIYIAIAAIIAMFRLTLKPKRSRKAMQFYGIGGVVSLLFVIPSCQYVLEQDLVPWMTAAIFGQWKRICLFLYWVLFSVLATILVCIGNSESKKVQTKTVVRKYFHILVLFVYIPGLILDADFLHLASVFAGAFFLLLEAIRVYSVPPFGQLIEQSFRMFVDEKDEGGVILTHIYLLVGLSLPLWMTNIRPVNGSHLLVYSGVISLGVGDTMASIGGTLFGRHKWPGSKKSIEGTILCSLSQLMALLILIYSGNVSCHLRLSLLIPVILSSLYEAFTLQIDNLVLPLLTYSLLCVS